MISILKESKNIFLADDDEDDRSFFQQGLKEVCNECSLTIAENGKVLMNLLSEKTPELPDLLFLDLNMPAKNGMECLAEIKFNSKLRELPVIIFSTTAQERVVNETYNLGASYYIVKPSDFNALKKVIRRIILMDWSKGQMQPEKERFILSVS